MPFPFIRLPPSFQPLPEKYLPKEELVKVGSLSSPTVEKLQNLQSWDAAFRSGERGALRVDCSFAPFPEGFPFWVSPLTKDNIALHFTSKLKKEGVVLYKKEKWEGNSLWLYFETGIAPLLIVAIILGVVAVIAVTIWQLSLYKVKIIETKTKAKVTESEFETSRKREQQVLNELLETAREIEDPQTRANVLRGIIQAEKARREQALGVFGEKEVGWKQPLMIFCVMAGIALVLFAFLKGR